MEQQETKMVRLQYNIMAVNLFLIFEVLLVTIQISLYIGFEIVLKLSTLGKKL